MPERKVRGRRRHPLQAAKRLWRAGLRRLGIGHRAAFLMGFGVIYGVIGVALVTGPSTPNPDLFHTELPDPLRVGMWCLCGAAAFVLANMPTWQWLGFAALVPPSTTRLLSYGLGTVHSLTEGPPPPWAYLPGLALYALVLFLLLLCASWPDPPSDPRRRRDRPGRARG